MGQATIFPASRELFNLVRAVADRGGEHMTDVDIGRVVGFESPRTSRWKYGKIAVDDAARLLALSQFFEIDLTLLANVAASYVSAADALDILGSERKLIRFLRTANLAQRWSDSAPLRALPHVAEGAVAREQVPSLVTTPSRRAVSSRALGSVSARFSVSTRAHSIP